MFHLVQKEIVQIKRTIVPCQSTIEGLVSFKDRVAKDVSEEHSTDDISNLDKMKSKNSKHLSNSNNNNNYNVSDLSCLYFGDVLVR